ncbi:MAG: DUF1403 family protein [Methylocystis sp.]|uniref:DUF1403 family protein n=1 Tax=Methylocystis sp. TaxID=1911079 RepID=UPI003DA32979
MSLLDSRSPPDAVSPARRLARPRRAAPPAAESAPQILPLPRWARPSGADRGSAFFAGAGLALLDHLLRAGPDGGEPDFAGCLRQRLALRAAESGAALARLREDAAALRDAQHLAGGAEPSPAGRIHRLFRLFAASPARPDAAALARAVALLGWSGSDAGAKGEGLAEVMAEVLRAGVAEAPDPLAAAAQASAAAMEICAGAPDAEIVALWAADLALAARLNWARPVPLLAAVLRDPALRRGAQGEARASRPRPGDGDWPASLARGYALAAVEAHALAVDLARRADRLLAVAPALRAKGERRVVELLLSDDAVAPAAAARAGLSDRAARRLFDRLVALGAVRELTGRESFRIYGL